MNTIDELVARGVTRVQHDTWNEGEYAKIIVVNSAEGAKRPAPNATQYTPKLEPTQVPVFTLASTGEAEWRMYHGPRSPHDLGE
jgi:hypothetical protein